MSSSARKPLLCAPSIFRQVKMSVPSLRLPARLGRILLLQDIAANRRHVTGTRSGVSGAEERPEEMRMVWMGNAKAISMKDRKTSFSSARPVSTASRLFRSALIARENSILAQHSLSCTRSHPATFAYPNSSQLYSSRSRVLLGPSRPDQGRGLRQAVQKRWWRRVCSVCGS